MKVVLLDRKYSEETWEFELENRDYFDSIDLGRDADYYERVNFQRKFEELLEEQDQGRCFMHLIFSDDGVLAGRINLADVVRGPFNKAELGYRIGEIHQGKGYATKATEVVLDMARHRYGLHRIEAGTGKENIGSQIVLDRNNFRLVGVYEQFVFQNDFWVDGLLYEKILDRKRNGGTYERTGIVGAGKQP